MRSKWRMLIGTVALMLAGLGVVWTLSNPPQVGSSAARVADGTTLLGITSNTPSYTVTVSDPYTPTLSVAVRDLPDKPVLPTLDREPVQRDNRGFVGPDIQMPPHGNPLAELQQSIPHVVEGLGIVANFPGAPGWINPPDTTGDVGLNHILQGVNSVSGTSQVFVWDKSGNLLDSFYMEDLATTAPCNNGYCDPIVQYDELADRWMVSEFDTSGNSLCVYISATPDPLGQWWSYAFNPPTSGFQDYPKYGVWPDGYYVGVNNGGEVIVLDRAHMLNGQPATMQTFYIGELPGFGFQLTEPATLEGDAPPAGAPAIFLRPRDTEIHGGTCPDCDLMELWAFHVDWITPSNSSLTPLPSAHLTDWDQTLCGTGSDWSCMSQPGTSQKLDPIREPVHYPTQYRNFGTHETLVGCFAEDVDGLDRAAVHWFELRRTPPGVGDWTTYQEGVLGDGVGDIHRSVCSAAMDSAGNIAVGYTRTGANAPYYPSIYYSGRLASDPLNTMPIYDQVIWNGTTSHTSSERWGDYSGIGVDPADGCTLWYTNEFGGSAQSRVAGLKFDECGTPDFTLNVLPPALDVCTPGDAVFDVTIGSVSGFTNIVTLASAGEPAGTTVSFVPNPVTPPESSVFTVGNTGSSAPGSYIITISGTATGSPGHEDNVTLNLFDTAPLVAELLLPVNGTTGELPRPTFDWSDVTGATSYEIEIASDPDFVNIVDSATGLTGSTYTPTAYLPHDSVFYWRVTAVNACGSTISAVNAFRTAASTCLTYISTDVPKPINDNTWTTSVVNIPDSFTVTDVDVIIDSLTHTYDGDLDIYIRHPDATQVELSTDNGGSGDNFIDTRFDDEAAISIVNGTAPFTGSYRPEGILATLDGKQSTGTWTLRVYDDAGGDSGSLNGWSVVVCGASGGEFGDYSDLDNSYGVAWHTGDGTLRLGDTWTLDDAFAPPGFDDPSDDGVTFPGGLAPGQPSTVRVNVQGTPVTGRWLNMWFDWNGDGIFGDLVEAEKVYSDAVVDGDNDIVVNVPSGAVSPVNFRTRLYDDDGARLRDADSWGGAAGGEVEDGTAPMECSAWLEVTPATDTKSGEPGTSVTYTLTVTNLGSCEDTFDVSLSGNLWNAEAPLVVGPISASASVPFNVTVDVPSTTHNGDIDALQVTLTSQFDPSMTDSSALTTTSLGLFKYLLPVVYRQ